MCLFVGLLKDDDQYEDCMGVAQTYCNKSLSEAKQYESAIVKIVSDMLRSDPDDRAWDLMEAIEKIHTAQAAIEKIHT